MIDVEALKRFLLLSGLLFTAVGWWRAEVHNAQLAELGDGFHGLARDCIDTSLTRLDDIESKRRELIDALRVRGSGAVAENNRQMNGLGLAGGDPCPRCGDRGGSPDDDDDQEGTAVSLGARSRRKGHAYERELARRFGDEAGCPAVRNLEEVRSGNSGDLVFTHGDPLCVQAKVGGRPSVWNAVKEAEEAAGPGVHPVAIVKRNGSGARPAVELACMPLDDFLELVGLLKSGEVW